jgi:hypothetical protein
MMSASQNAGLRMVFGIGTPKSAHDMLIAAAHRTQASGCTSGYRGRRIQARAVRRMGELYKTFNAQSRNTDFGNPQK